MPGFHVLPLRGCRRDDATGHLATGRRTLASLAGRTNASVPTQSAVRRPVAVCSIDVL